MNERFTIRVTKDYLSFCAGHFISYQGHQCERLHGHNYRAAVEVEGPLDDNFYVFDFIALKNATRRIIDELDHFMLLPTKNPVIHVEERGAEVHARYKERHWSFPRGDCVLLPIENTTAELLARFIAGRLLVDLRERHRFIPDLLRVEVEEGPGQMAIFEQRREV
jgi:6-pyruvoyltetrahydropterin/6-carboxytetrahydropterin synthase